MIDAQDGYIVTMTLQLLKALSTSLLKGDDFFKVSMFFDGGKDLKYSKTKTKSRCTNIKHVDGKRMKDLSKKVNRCK